PLSTTRFPYTTLFRSVELTYSRNFGPVNFTGSANFATLKNKVTHVADDVDFISGDAGFQNMGAVTRIQVGHSYNEFFGYVSDGIDRKSTRLNSSHVKN